MPNESEQIFARRLLTVLIAEDGRILVADANEQGLADYNNPDEAVNVSPFGWGDWIELSKPEDIIEFVQ